MRGILEATFLTFVFLVLLVVQMLEGLVANKRKVIICRNEYILALGWYNQLSQAYFKKMSADLLQVCVCVCAS